MAELPASVIQARTAAQEAVSAAGQLGAMEPTISDVLKQKVTEAYANNQDIIKPLDTATQEYLQAPQVAREQYQNIFNPFTREKLVSQYVGNKALPMLSLSNIYGNRLGRVEDVIGAGVRGFQAQTMAQQAKAEQARQFYQDLLSEYTILQQQQAQEQAAELERQRLEASLNTTQEVTANGRKYLVTYDQFGNIIKQTDLGSSTSGTGTGTSGYGDLMAILGMTGNLGVQQRLPIETAVTEIKTPFEIANEQAKAAAKKKATAVTSYKTTAVPSSKLTGLKNVNFSGVTGLQGGISY